jgi:hypothetical protein
MVRASVGFAVSLSPLTPTGGTCDRFGIVASGSDDDLKRDNPKGLVWQFAYLVELSDG